VFGISGVGKSTIIEQFARGNSNWRVLNVSKLLSESEQLESEQLRTSSRKRIEENQFELAELVRALRIQEPNKNWLLDAHSVIDNDSELVSVPVDAVVRLAPTDLVFIFDEPIQIQLRRRGDQFRRRPKRSIEQIAEEQDLARRNSLLYSHALGLTLREVCAGDLDGLATILKLE
jgi:adenylate kinase